MCFRRPVVLSVALALSSLPAVAADVEADWHFTGASVSTGTLHAAAGWSLSRFFAIEATGWLPLPGSGVANLIDGRALFTMPMSSLLGMGMTVSPWAGYRAAVGASSVSHGPGFGLQMATANHDFPIAFRLEGGIYPFMTDGRNWFEYSGTVGYQILEGVQINGGFRSVSPIGGTPFMGPFLGARFGG